MVFIKLHLYDRDHPVDHELYLNADHILSLEPIEGHSMVKMINNDEVEVEETVEKVLTQMALKRPPAG